MNEFDDQTHHAAGMESRYPLRIPIGVDQNPISILKKWFTEIKRAWPDFLSLVKKENIQQCYSLSEEKTKIGDRIKNAELLIVRIISGLKIVIMTGEKTKIGSSIQIGEKDSIARCLTKEKRL